jgi:glycosyltransferase involved in cell wall biosynthesis
MFPLFEDRPSKYFDPRVGWRIRKLLQKQNIRFVGLQHHYHGLLLRPFLMGLGIKTFVFSHNLEFQRWKSIGKWWWPIMKWTESYVYHWVDAVFFISHQESLAAPTIFNLPVDKCKHAPYPIDISESPAPRPLVRKQIAEELGISHDDKLLLFFGPQTYLPNLRAVEAIVTKIHPILRLKASFVYHILICGGGLPNSHQQYKDLSSEGIHYLGFVPKIEDYVLSADIVLNPVNIGGGVKTKLVEAVAMGKTVVSSESGAQGVIAEAYGSKLVQVADEDWEAFAQAILDAMPRVQQVTPDSFYALHAGSNAVSGIVKWLHNHSQPSVE